MSTVGVWLGRARNSSQVHEARSATAPRISNVHSVSGVWGVGPADRTGKSATMYWPGGTRPGSTSRRRPWKPREIGPRASGSERSVVIFSSLWQVVVPVRYREVRLETGPWPVAWRSSRRHAYGRGMNESGSTLSLDSLGQYLREIGRHRLLTAAEEVRLAKRIEQGDVAAVHRLVESNLRLVVAVARGHAYRGVPLLDLIQEGTLGLMRAAERFDWRRGTKFSTYAMWWIRQAVERALCNQSDPIRVPVHVHERRRRLARAEQELEFELTRKPSVGELASAADLTLEQAERALGARRGFMSLDASEADDARIADPQAWAEFERVDQRLTATRLEEILAVLEPQQRRVIELRFGLRGEECSTERTAELLDTSARRVAALERRALRRLRELTSPLEMRLAA